MNDVAANAYHFVIGAAAGLTLVFLIARSLRREH